MAPPDVVRIAEKFERITEHWRPKVVAELNGQEVKLVKLHGEFVWHAHPDVDELFLGWHGEFRIELRDGVLPVRPGELVVVPRGVEHRPVAEQEAWALLFEPKNVRNTGDAAPSLLTAPDGVRI